MCIRHAALAAAAGSALLAAAALPSEALADPNPLGAASNDFASYEGTVSASDLLAKVNGCSQISNGGYRTDEEAPENIPVCAMNGAVFWQADLDIDCDGQPTDRCNDATDPWFQAETSFQQSDGAHLSAETLPYIVVPSPSGIWDYGSSRIMDGTVAAVIYGDRVQYAVVGDTGPTGIIGEASYATAEALGINPDPMSGGVESGVTYILFENSRVSAIESQSGAVTLGEALARDFLQNN
ncbi:glycoside hydrolase family 75 protein [Streptomyces maoxianensis]|uniref:Glycoside hydrolase family 75 protein n=1 Tax=Streptomyces maoxianensis TaxID=1459942 RepID=A0ABV9G1K2_9ACTN